MNFHFNNYFFINRVFPRDVMSAILVTLNNDKSAMLVSQINPEGVELFYNKKNHFVSLNRYGHWTRHKREFKKSFHVNTRGSRGRVKKQVNELSLAK